MSNEILVLGGTGKTGRRIVARLTDLGLPVRIGSRNANPAFDWENQSTWLDVLLQIDKVYISFQPDLAIPGSAEKINEFVNAARQSGVKQMVLLSGRGESEAQQCENVIMNSQLDWSIVRPSWFMQNFSEGFLMDGIMSGHLVLPPINAREPFIDADDIADVVTKIFIDDSFNKKIIELTGPELLSFNNAIYQISVAINRPIHYEEVSINQYTETMKEYEVPDDLIWLTKYLFTEIMDGRNESLTNNVENILGRKAGSFEAYINKAIASGAWKRKEIPAS